MAITWTSIILTCTISAILIIFYGVILNNKRILKNVGIDFLGVFLIGILLKLCFPFEFKHALKIPTNQGLMLNKMSYIDTFESNVNGGMNLIDWLIVLWILGIIFFLIRFLYKAINTEIVYKKIIRYGKVYRVSDFILSTKKDYLVVVSSQIKSPMILGYHQVIIFPDIVFTSNELSQIISHEIQHILNKDIYLKTLINLVVIVYWWYYPVYLLRKYVDLFLELRVDQRFLVEGMDSKSLAYVESLVSVSKKIKNHKTLSSVSVSYISSKSSLWVRVHCFLEGNMKRKTNKIVLICILMIPVLFSMITLKGSEQTSKPQEEVNYIFPEEQAREMADRHFSDLDENDKVLRLPGGGWLYGGATEFETDSYGNAVKEIASYDSETDKNAVTVKEAREIMYQEFITGTYPTE